MVASEVLRGCDILDEITDRKELKAIPGSRKAGAKARHRENHKKEGCVQVLGRDCSGDPAGCPLMRLGSGGPAQVLGG